MTIDYTETVSTQSPTEGSEVSYLKSNSTWDNQSVNKSYLSNRYTSNHIIARIINKILSLLKEH